jgi:P4 family phage/plasmid primase-like protien
MDGHSSGTSAARERSSLTQTWAALRCVIGRYVMGSYTTHRDWPMHVLPPASPGHEYAERTHNGQSYITTGLFSVGSPSHTREQLYRAPALIFDADLADALSHQPERYGWRVDPAQTAKTIKNELLHLDGQELDRLLSVHSAVVREALNAHLGQLPTVMTVSGYGHHCYYWLATDWGLASDHGPHGANALRVANAQVVAAINGASGYPLLDRSCVDTGTRLMRQIGTYNTKGPRRVEVVPVIHEQDRLLLTLPPRSQQPVHASQSQEGDKTFLELRGDQVVETEDGSTTVEAFHLDSTHQIKRRAICPFSDSTTMGAAWLQRGDTVTFLFCSADHHHGHRRAGCAGWLYRPLVFRRGDHAEVAKHIIDNDLPEHVVYDQGALHTYTEASGTWAPLESSEVQRIVMEYGGTSVGAKKPRALHVTQAVVKGVVQCIHQQCHRRGFFDDAPSGIGFANGFLRPDGKLEAHAPEHRLLACHKLPYPFDPAASCPRWEQFLGEVFEGDEDAMDKIAFLQEFAGAALMGRATNYQKHPLMWGPGGANGKSVLIETLGSLFPEASRASSSPHDWATRFGKASLLYARINLVTELNEQDLLDTGPLKAVLTGDSILYEQKYKEAFSFRPRAGHLLAVNSLPAIKNPTNSFYRRFVVICFNRQFSEEDQDPTLKDKLLHECSGIAAWAVRGAQRRDQATTYTIPCSALAAEKMWSFNNNSVAHFAEECLVTTSEPMLPSAALYGMYRAWTADEGLRTVSHRRFTQRLNARGYSRTRRRQGWMWAVQRRSDAP